MMNFMSFGSVFPSALADFTHPESGSPNADPDPGSQSNADPMLTRFRNTWYKRTGTVKRT
jgi:hypothetical protein